MEKVNVKKLSRVEAPVGEYADIVAFQLVEFEIDFFGNKDTFVLDTKIMNDGRQVVIDGNGWIASGYEVQ